MKTTQAFMEPVFAQLGRYVAALGRPVLAVSLLAALATVAQAQAPAAAPGGFGAAFRPQALPQAAVPSGAGGAAGAAPAASAAAAAGGDDEGAGLRVLVTGGRQNLASIDGRIVKVGDRINGMRVTQITPRGVVLTGQGGAREELKLNPAAEKKPAYSTRISQGARP